MSDLGKPIRTVDIPEPDTTPVPMPEPIEEPVEVPA